MILGRVKICCDGGVMRDIQGFTLIELMVTIAVLAVIAMMAAPSFNNTLTNQKLKQTLVEVKSGLAEARSRAMLTRSNTILCPNKSDSGVSISQASCGANLGNYSTLSSSQQTDSVLLAKISDKVTIKSGSSLSFQFNSQGMSTEQKMTICGANRSYIINVYIPGTISVTEASSC